MLRLLAGVCALVLAGTAARADDKKAAAPKGTWTRESGGIEIKMQFVGKDKIKGTVTVGDNAVTTTGKFTFKDGVVKVTITGVEEKGNFPNKPEKGLEFSFKWKVKKPGVAELTDLEGKGLDDAKMFVEGDYSEVK